MLPLWWCFPALLLLLLIHRLLRELPIRHPLHTQLAALHPDCAASSAATAIHPLFPAPPPICSVRWTSLLVIPIRPSVGDLSPFLGLNPDHYGDHAPALRTRTITPCCQPSSPACFPGFARCQKAGVLGTYLYLTWSVAICSAVHSASFPLPALSLYLSSRVPCSPRPRCYLIAFGCPPPRTKRQAGLSSLNLSPQEQQTA